MIFDINRKVKTKKGQVVVEYIATTMILFSVLILFYQYYSWIVPEQFERAAKVILTVYKT